MKSNVLASIALTWFSAVFTTILVLVLSEEGWRALLVGIISILLINSIHILALQLIIIPLTDKHYYNSTERFFFAVLPWLVVSGILLLVVYNQGPVLYSIIAIQYFPAVLSFHFYYAEKRKEELHEKEYALLIQEREAKLLEQTNPISTE